ncbi:PREDICTED: uncharacterized protein LOC105971998 [Erythranthe guttata]|uniref:uncharacterized protein LOC105971998 n=1 Tax=Erythranthe guttata TaxID=4155 RepID=UPI00064DCF3E|nr:PREDICTED: uncharacterized protein LOC105971998 [Erythranthe guttata]|eukprot:XP_012852387.1 PREDICTED: uncharacterized protein LOC105971998 [Erythranthe guttata]
MATTNGAFPFQKLAKENYDRWSIQMKTFLGGQDVWEAVEEEYVEPENLASLSEAQKKTSKEAKVQDQRALSIIQLGVDDSNFEKISQATTAKQAWDILNDAFKGIDKVKKVQIQSLRGEFKSLKMKYSEDVSDYVSRVVSIVNQLERNGETILEERRVVEKISIDPKFDYIVVGIEESNDVESLKVNEILGKLQVHEEKIKRRNKGPEVEQALQVKTNLADQPKYDGPRFRGRGRGRGRGRVVVVAEVVKDNPRTTMMIRSKRIDQQEVVDAEDSIGIKTSIEMSQMMKRLIMLKQRKNKLPSYL